MVDNAPDELVRLLLALSEVFWHGEGWVLVLSGKPSCAPPRLSGTVKRRGRQRPTCMMPGYFVEVVRRRVGRYTLISDAVEYESYDWTQPTSTFNF